jgi:hypothetical protein
MSIFSLYFNSFTDLGLLPLELMRSLVTWADFRQSAIEIAQMQFDRQET